MPVRIRKDIGFNRGWITYNPHDHKWLELTVGEFASTWSKTAIDGDLCPQGFRQKFSIKLPSSSIENVTLTGAKLIPDGEPKSTHSCAVGGQVAGKLKFGCLTLSPCSSSNSTTNWPGANLCSYG